MINQGLLKYSADRRTIAFLGIYFAMLYYGWFYAPIYSLTMVAVVAFLSLWTFFIAVMTHNTIHSPIFHNTWLNRLFSVALTIGFGSPASGFLPGHNLSHHRFLSTRRDNIRSYKMRFRWNLLNQVLFFWVMLKGIVHNEQRFVKNVAKDPDARGWYLQYRVETVVHFGIKAIAFYVDWRKALLLVLIPNVYGVWAIFGTNYWQHDGCDEKHPYNHSRTFRSKLLNFFAFNNGYHTVHHDKPGLHWSLLPGYHAEHYTGRLHPELDRVSLAAYLFKTCVYPGTRVNYDGTPYVLPPADEDIDWVADAFSTGASRMVYSGIGGKEEPADAESQPA